MARADNADPKPDQKTRRSSDMRDRILKEATRQFSAEGFSGASLAEISSAVGIRKPSLLYHFASKEVLYESVLDETFRGWNDILPRLLLSSTTGKGRFEAVVQEAIAFFSEDSNRARLLVREALDRPESLKSLFQRHIQRWTEAMSEYIDAGKGTGQIRPGVDAEAYIVNVIAMLVMTMAATDALKGLVASPSDDAPQFDERLVSEAFRALSIALFRERGSGDSGND